MTAIKIKQQQRKSLAMKVTPHGIEVLIPRYLAPNSAQVQAFIDNGLQKLSPTSASSVEPTSASSVEPPPAAAQTLSKAEILALIEQWRRRLGVRVKRIQFQPMPQKWGSISTAGNLTLADALPQLPPHLVEYIICHELLHLQVPRHNRLYYLRLSQHIPDWPQREQALARWVLAVRET